MSLLQLPPETLKQIFDHIDSAFFHEDLGRLTVCKQWFEFARPVCFKSITLSQDNLCILTSRSITKLLPLTNSLEWLDLELDGYRDLVSMYSLRQYVQEPHVHWATTMKKSGLPLDSINGWMKHLDEDLAKLAIIVQRSRKLRVLRIAAWSSPIRDDPWTAGPENYFSMPTMQALLSMENLRVLFLDLSAGFLGPPSEVENNGHICLAIGALLHTLETLHLRMRRICPDVLKPRDPNGILRLSEVVVHLSLNLNFNGTMEVSQSKRCGVKEAAFLRNKADIQEQAEILATRMASPKVFRILTTSPSALRTWSLDVLTGKIMRLKREYTRDDDGEIAIEDVESEDESESDVPLYGPFQ
ncbi:hypothetical protein FDECE_11713 [Fusarium decemcellulare]|nr:hypothetical protein FDECE_11713 [Fusarium decemcellulare]